MIEKQNIGLRAQDFHEALKVTRSFGPKEAYFGKTLLIGKCASLAMHLKGLLYIEDYTGLQYAAAELGVNAVELPEILRKLQDVDFIRVVETNGEVSRIDIRVPEFRSGYEDLGELWTRLKPSEVEQAGVNTLSDLLNSPKAESDLATLGLDVTQLAIMTDVMSSGQLMRAQTVSGEKLVYSPLAVDADPVAYLQWTQRYSDEVSKLLGVLIQNQGLHSSSNLLVGKSIVNDAVLSGVLMPVKVKGATGEQSFLFAPRGGLSQEERIILDKARAILASVRYGQNFAAGRPIKYPRALLQQLIDRKRFRQGHPDLKSQYSLLVEKLIGRPVKEANNRWNFEIIDTDENMKALQIAMDMLEFGETPATHINIQAKNAILNPRGYLGPVSTRTVLATTVQSSPETEADIVKKIGNLGRGILGF